ncbi:hypothetical protein GGS20DRAFT_558902 [Poronia punctata]|nr:hypothetical protein GGS20DRAFT_558902 [Poronia punctata]
MNPDLKCSGHTNFSATFRDVARHTAVTTCLLDPQVSGVLLAFLRPMCSLPLPTVYWVIPCLQYPRDVSIPLKVPEQVSWGDGSSYPPQANMDQLASGFGGLSTYDGGHNTASSAQTGLSGGYTSYNLSNSPGYTHNTGHNNPQGYGQGALSGVSHNALLGEGENSTGLGTATATGFGNSPGGYNPTGPDGGHGEGVGNDELGQDEDGHDTPVPGTYYSTSQSTSLNSGTFPISSGGSGGFGPVGSGGHGINYGTALPVEHTINHGLATDFTQRRNGEPPYSGPSYPGPRYGQRQSFANAFSLSMTPRVTPGSSTYFGNTSQFDYGGRPNYNNSNTSMTHLTGLRRPEPTDPRFKVEHSSKFVPGRVFKVYWAQPRGQSHAHSIAPTGFQTLADPSLGPFHVGYRRFLIVKTDASHHSTCVPILTYELRACCKPGVSPGVHGVIHSSTEYPWLKPGEPALGFDPVPLDIWIDGETLAKESRVNYSKLDTIEHNTKVFFIGSVPDEHFETVSYAVKKCWEESLKQPRRKRKDKK